MAIFVAGIRNVEPKLKDGKMGKPFVALDLVEFRPVTSKLTGRDYIGKVGASVTLPLEDKATAEVIYPLGSEFPHPGSIVVTPLEKPFDYTTKDGRKVKVTTRRDWVAAK